MNDTATSLEQRKANDERIARHHPSWHAPSWEFGKSLALRVLEATS